MDLKQIYDLTEDAEKIEPNLVSQSQRYGNIIDFYHHTEDNSCEIDGPPISKEQLLEETLYIAEIIEEYENMFHRLEDAMEEIEDCSNHNFIDGQKIDRYSVTERLDSVLKSYSDHLGEAMEICNRTAYDPSIPNPLIIKSRRQNNVQPENSLEELIDIHLREPRVD